MSKAKIQDSKVNSGYIAITVSIILSVIVVAIAIAFGSSNLLTRSDFLDFNNKQLSFSIARSCLNYALLRLAENSNYVGNDILNISEQQCTISPIETSGSNKIIKVKAQISGATTNFRLTVNSSSLATVSLEELSTF